MLFSVWKQKRANLFAEGWPWKVKSEQPCPGFLLETGATGLEPAIFGLTGRRVNHYTTPPCYAIARGILAEIRFLVKFTEKEMIGG